MLFRISDTRLDDLSLHDIIVKIIKKIICILLICLIYINHFLFQSRFQTPVWERFLNVKLCFTRFYLNVK